MKNGRFMSAVMLLLFVIAAFLGYRFLKEKQEERTITEIHRGFKESVKNLRD
jgi:hypothetical protein